LIKSPGNENNLYKLGFFQKYFGHVWNINSKVVKKVLFFLNILFLVHNNLNERKKLKIKLKNIANISKNLLSIFSFLFIIKFCELNIVFIINYLQKYQILLQFWWIFTFKYKKWTIEHVEKKGDQNYY